MTTAGREARQVDGLIDAAFSPKLAACGFAPIGSRRWVRSTKRPIREVVVVAALKGAAYIPICGVSLDFVPHRSGTGFGHHRTDKSAVLDLRVEPVDWPERYPTERLLFSRAGAGRRRLGLGRASRDVRRSAGTLVEVASAWFDRIDDLQSLLSVFNEALTMPVHRFGFDNYVQHRLAYAFVLAALGMVEQSRQELELWLARHGDDLDPDARRWLLGRLHAVGADGGEAGRRGVR